jgi:hypothetical protein
MVQSISLGSNILNYLWGGEGKKGTGTGEERKAGRK